MRYILTFLVFGVLILSDLKGMDSMDGGVSDPPVVICRTGAVFLLNPANFIQIEVATLVDSVSDDTGPVVLGLIKSGTGTGFPVNALGNPQTSIEFTCCQLGTYFVEVWAKDMDGNSSYCETSVVIQDNAGNCDCPQTEQLSGIVKTEAGDGLEQGLVYCKGSHPVLPPFVTFDLTHFNLTVPEGQDIELGVDSISTDINPVNGVSTYDLVLISKHILGISPLGSPYKMIAADANKSGSITTFDIVELRKLILGVYSKLPHNFSWRFVPKSFVFPNPNNPFEGSFPSKIYFNNIDQNYNSLDFVAIKTGDVNNSAQAVYGTAEDRRRKSVLIKDLIIKKGDQVNIPLRLEDFTTSSGFQMGLKFDSGSIGVEDVWSDVDGFSGEHFAFPEAGMLTISWSGMKDVTLDNNQAMVWLKIRAKEDLRLSEVLFASKHFPAEIYDGEAQIVDLNFRFSSDLGVSNTLMVSPQPNLGRGDLHFVVQSESEESKASLEVFDLNGVLLFEVTAQLNTRMNELIVPAIVFPNPGVYLWRMRVGERVRIGKIVRE